MWIPVDVFYVFVLMVNGLHFPHPFDTVIYFLPFIWLEASLMVVLAINTYDFQMDLQ